MINPIKLFSSSMQFSLFISFCFSILLLEYISLIPMTLESCIWLFFLYFLHFDSHFDYIRLQWLICLLDKFLHSLISFSMAHVKHHPNGCIICWLLIWCVCINKQTTDINLNNFYLKLLLTFVSFYIFFVVFQIKTSSHVF